MNQVKQPPGTPYCGQACVAMVLGLNLAQAVELVGTHRKSGTTILELAPVLRAHGVECSARLFRISERRGLPPRAIVRMRSKKKKGWGHWVLRWDGDIYCPVEGKNPKMGKDEFLSSYALIT